MAQITREQRHEYAQARRLAEQRTGRLEQAGFKGYHAPKLADLKNPADFKREFAKLNRWNERETATVRGARIVQEQRRTAQRERAQERRRERAAAEGRQYQPRPPKQTDEQRREKRREYNRRYREKVKARKEDIENGLKGYSKTHTAKQTQAMENLLAGLRKHGIKINSFPELAAWGKYIKERETDSKQDFYMFDLWLNEAAEELGKPKEKVTGEDIERMIDDFNRWQENNAELLKEYTRERQSNEYSAADVWEMYAWRNM